MVGQDLESRVTPEEVVRELIKHKRSLMSILWNGTQSKEVAEDLFGEVSRKAIKYVHNFERRASLYTWLYRIAANQLIDFYRNRTPRRFSSYEDELGKPEVATPFPVHGNYYADPEVALLARENEALLQEAYSTLSPKHQQVLDLREFRGMEYKQIAEHVGISVGTVMSRLHHARRNFVAALNRRGLDYEFVTTKNQS